MAPAEAEVSGKEIVVPVYLHCPHCEHPQVVPAARRGRVRFCRQCGRAYRTSLTSETAEPIRAASLADLGHRLGGRPKVFILAA